MISAKGMALAQQLAAGELDESTGGADDYFRPQKQMEKESNYKENYVVEGLRFLRDPKDEDNWITMGVTHYFNSPKNARGFGASGTCPSHFDKPCPACIAFEEYIGKADEDQRKILRSLKLQKRVYFNVYDPTSERVLKWSLPCNSAKAAGRRIIDDILFLANKKPSVDVLSHVKGRNYILKLEPNDFGRFAYTGHFSDTNSKLPPGAKGWQKNLFNLSDIPKEYVLKLEEIQASTDYYLGQAGLK